MQTFEFHVSIVIRCQEFLTASFWPRLSTLPLSLLMLPTKEAMDLLISLLKFAENTRNSATEEKQCVSCAGLAKLANWSCNALNNADVVQLDYSPVLSTVSAMKASDIRGRWSFLTLYTHIRLSRSSVFVNQSIKTRIYIHCVSKNAQTLKRYSLKL